MASTATTNPVSIDKASCLLNDVGTKDFIKKIDSVLVENKVSENSGKFLLDRIRDWFQRHKII